MTANRLLKSCAMPPAEAADGFHSLVRRSCSLQAFALRQVERYRDAPGALEAREGDEHRHAGTVLAEILLLPVWGGAVHPEELGRGGGARLPLGRRHLGPVHQAGVEIVAGVAHDLQEGVVRLADEAGRLGDGDADDAGVGQPLAAGNLDSLELLLSFPMGAPHRGLAQLSLDGGGEARASPSTRSRARPASLPRPRSPRRSSPRR